MSKFGKLMLIAILVLITIIDVKAQEDLVTYSFKKGEVMDVLLLNSKDGIEEVRKRYFETATPIARKRGYTPMPYFSILESPLRGNYHPDAIVIASWPSVEVRKTTLVELETTLLDFHDMRREIWSTFNIAYYEMAKDMSFTIDKSKYNVATAYWAEDNQSMDAYMSRWTQLIEATNGIVVVQLTGAGSVFGYVYKPDYLVVSSWDSKEAFEVFRAQSLKMDHIEVEHVQQFKLQ